MAPTKEYKELMAVGRSLDMSEAAMTEEEFTYAVDRYHALQELVKEQNDVRERD